MIDLRRFQKAICKSILLFSCIEWQTHGTLFLSFLITCLGFPLYAPFCRVFCRQKLSCAALESFDQNTTNKALFLKLTALRRTFTFILKENQT